MTKSILTYGSCHESDLTWWAYLIVFSLIATTIRFKSIIHAFLEMRMQIYNWLMAQLGIWILQKQGSLNTSAHSDKRGNDTDIDDDVVFDVFVHIHNFHTLLKYHGTPHEDKEHGDTKAVEITPLISNSGYPFYDIIVLASSLTCLQNPIHMQNWKQW